MILYHRFRHCIYLSSANIVGNALQVVNKQCLVRVTVLTLCGLARSREVGSGSFEVSLIWLRLADCPEPMSGSLCHGLSPHRLLEVSDQTINVLLKSGQIILYTDKRYKVMIIKATCTMKVF